MALDRYEIRHNDGHWAFIKVGGQRATRTFEKKTDAVKYASEFGKTHDFSLRIKDESGKIQEERTYPRSKDPKSSKG
ncbi:MAG TPA: DUF2188 domain-containing protein [Hyphomicrobiaceae bacterium]|nr:DUF2188 domain-containing protein [Hyphomicrobiaceae bacterium]